MLNYCIPIDSNFTAILEHPAKTSRVDGPIFNLVFYLRIAEEIVAKRLLAESKATDRSIYELVWT